MILQLFAIEDDKLVNFTFNHADQVDEFGKATGDFTVVQTDFDSRATELQTKHNSLIDTLKSFVSVVAGAFQIGHKSANVVAENVGDALEEIAVVAKGSNPTSNIYSVLDYGLAGLGLTGDSTALNTLITNIGATEATILFPSLMTSEAVYLIDANVVFPDNINVVFNEGALLKISNTFSVTSTNTKLTAGLYQIFDLSLGGTIIGDWIVESAFPVWWGTDGVDDTFGVQSAFDSGMPVKFDRNYYVTTVEMKKARANIDFVEYSLVGISATPNTDSVLKLTGSRMKLYNIAVGTDFNTNYKCVLHWYSPYATPAQYNYIYSLYLFNTIDGIQFGDFFSEALPNAPQSENYIYGYTTRGIQNVLNTWQENGYLTIIGGTLDCNQNEWTTQMPNPFSDTDANCFDNRETNLTIQNCEILKTTTQLGYVMKGEGFKLFNCAVESGAIHYKLSGGALIDNVEALQSSDDKSVFDLDASIEGTLRITNYFHKRPLGVGSYSGSYIFDGISGAPDLKMVLENAEFEEWGGGLISTTLNDNNTIKNTSFWYMSGPTKIKNFIDSLITIDTLPSATVKQSKNMIVKKRSGVGEEDTPHICLQTINTSYVWRPIQIVKGGVTGVRPTIVNQYEMFFDDTLGKPIWVKSIGPVVWVDAVGTVV